MTKLSVLKKSCILLLIFIATGVVAPTQTTPVVPHAPTFTTLHSFDDTDGAYPFAGLLQAANGNFLGAGFIGGTNNAGTVFGISSTGKFVTLDKFVKKDGERPRGTLIQATNGHFYGTAMDGGTEAFGTIFELNSSGEMTTLHSFDKTDGAKPYAGLLQASDGNFYGTTYLGGTTNTGTVFKMTPDGVLTTIYSFCSKRSCSDGAFPWSELVQGLDGNLYGTTYGGGLTGCYNAGCGTIFRITRDGVFTKMHTFCAKAGCEDGYQPVGGLVVDASGNLYGTTNRGGGSYGGGVVFKITPSGELTTLCIICGDIDNFCGNGSYLNGTLVLGTDGNLYGAASFGGACSVGPNGCGTIFQVTPSGAVAAMHSFEGPPNDGEMPRDGLVQGTDGNFYGTTAYGGTNDVGTVYTLSVGLGPFIKPSPAFGKEGAKIGILGNNLTGATTVTFNGASATFNVRSATLIVAEVPSGATTGKVQVQLPSGTLSSNVPFIVLLPK